MRGFKTIALALLALGISLALAACGGGDGDGDGQATAAATTSGAAAVAGFDQPFIDAMVLHHQQAIETAQLAKDAGLSEPDLVEIADNVIATQQAEIDQLLEWRTEWFGSDQVDPNAGEALGMSMEDMGMTDASDMFSSAADVDAMFATMMMDHHNGAITMAEMALEQAERPEIKELAQQIIEAQQAEIATMMPYAGGDMGGMDM